MTNTTKLLGAQELMVAKNNKMDMANILYIIIESEIIILIFELFKNR
jgi:hypothetical protein